MSWLTEHQRLMAAAPGWRHGWDLWWGSCTRCRGSRRPKALRTWRCPPRRRRLCRQRRLCRRCWDGVTLILFMSPTARSGWGRPASCRSHRAGPALVTQSGMEETMAERSVAWDTGEAISGTPFRHMIKAADTGSRFSAQLAVVKAGELIIPHSHRDEDEFSFVFRGRIGGRVATTTWWLR